MEKYLKPDILNNQAPDIQTGKRLLESARIEFSSRGYFNTNVDTITKRAGISHGTFYLYFNNKQDVLIKLVHEMNDEIIASIKNDGAFESARFCDDAAELGRAISGIIEIIISSSGIFTSFIQGMVQNKEIFDLFGKTTRDIAGFFSTGLKSRSRKSADAEIIAQIMAIALLMSAFIQSINIIKCVTGILAANLAAIFFSIINFKDRMIKKPGRKKAAEEKISYKTRMELIKSARHEFARHGYFDASAGDIAKKAGYSRGTFYKYFNDKDSLMQVILREMFDRISESDSMLDVMIGRVNPASVDDLIEISTAVVNIFESYYPVHRAVLQGAFFSRRIGEDYRLVFDRFSEPIVKKIDKLKEDGKCRGVDALVAAQIILATSSYSAFMFSAGFIKTSKDIFARNLAAFLHNFLNFLP